MSTAALCPACSAPLPGFGRRCRECDWTQPPAAKPAPAEPAPPTALPDYIRVRSHLDDAQRHLGDAIGRHQIGAHATGGECDRKAALYFRAAADLLDPVEMQGTRREGE